MNFQPIDALYLAGWSVMFAAFFVSQLTVRRLRRRAEKAEFALKNWATAIADQMHAAIRGINPGSCVRLVVKFDGRPETHTYPNAVLEGIITSEPLPTVIYEAYPSREGDHRWDQDVR